MGALRMRGVSSLGAGPTVRTTGTVGPRRRLGPECNVFDRDSKIYVKQAGACHCAALVAFPCSCNLWALLS